MFFHRICFINVHSLSLVRDLWPTLILGCSKKKLFSNLAREVFMLENDSKIVFIDNTNVNFNFYIWKFENLKIYEFVNTVDFEKLSL